MNYVEIINNYNKKIEDISYLKEFIDFCLLKLDLKNVMFNVIIISNEDIHKINKKYRNIDRPTDVISFALEDDKSMVNTSVRILGDIYISYDKVKSQSLDYNHSIKREICFLAVHGLLHLLGYDHMKKDEEEIMFNLQKELLDAYGIKR